MDGRRFRTMAERVGFEPTCLVTQTKRFRGAPVTATSVPLRNIFTVIPGRSDASLAEELQEEGGRLVREDASRGLDPMIELRSENAQRLEPTHGADLEVGGAEDETADTRVDRGTETHQAGLDRAVQGRADQSIVPELAGRVAHGENLGVTRRIVEGERRVVPTADDRAVGDEDRADGNLARDPREPGLVQGRAHEPLVLAHAHSGLPDDTPRRAMVGPEGLEPPTYWFVASRSIQLSYGPWGARLSKKGPSTQQKIERGS